MIRFLVSIVISLAAAAVGLLVAAALLDDVYVNASGFIIAVGGTRATPSVSVHGPSDRPDEDGKVA